MFFPSLLPSSSTRQLLLIKCTTALPSQSPLAHAVHTTALLFILAGGCWSTDDGMNKQR